MTKTKKTKIITIILSVVLFTCAIILTFQFVRIANLNSTQKKLQSNLNGLQTDIVEYTERNAYYADRQNFLEEYARDVYGWGKADRTYFELN